MPRTRFQLAVPAPFELPLALTGHGWYDLAPHDYVAGDSRFTTVIAVREAAVDVAIEVAHHGNRDKTAAAGGLKRTRHLAIQVEGAAIAGGAIGGAAARTTVKRALRRMLRLDHDFAPFFARCAERPTVEWAARRGGGRLLASATLFEDLMKILFTTNCSWAATKGMAARLCAAIGPRAPSGRSAFPTPAACAATDDAFWRDTVRAGYRGKAARRLAERFVSGEIDEATLAGTKLATLATPELRERLLSLAGFGPYAAGLALRLLGRHDDLALDSWCRARLATLANRKRPPSDRAVARRYARYGDDRGLVLWLELTAAWHGETSIATQR